ncbi:hypothetical protein [Brevibacillus borstelensis]|uniref:hypothetical protein n=1 Tax=Brevibacillus borstelensis TaxID=45462 RepID=UPI0030F6C207
MDILDRQLKQRKELVHDSLRLTQEEVSRLEQRTLASQAMAKSEKKRFLVRTCAIAGVAAVAAILLWAGPLAQLPEENPSQLVSPPVTTPNHQQTPAPALPEAPKQTVAWQTEADKLAFYRVFSLGMTYDEAKALFPELGELQPLGGIESLGADGLQEAFMPVTLGDEQVQLTLSFEHGFLYAARYQIESKDEQRIMQKKAELETFYASDFGSPKEEALESGTSSAWSPFFGLGLTKNWDGRYILIWGLQGGEEALEELYRDREFTVQEAIERALSEQPEFPARTGETRQVRVEGIPETLATTSLRTKVKLQTRDSYLVTFERMWTIQGGDNRQMTIPSYWTYEVTEKQVKLVDSYVADREVMEYLHAAAPPPKG